MKTFKKMLLLLLFAAIHMQTIAQVTDDTRRVGLSATIQGNQFGFLLPIWVGEHLSIAPSIEVKSAAGIASEYGIGIIPRYYFATEKVAPYVGLRAGAIFYQPAKAKELNLSSTTDVLVGAAFGSDYFFDPHFSIGVELQGNFTFSDKNSIRFNNPGKVNFNTASAVILSIYF